MGTPTWVRHVQETEWSFHEWHSSCPVRTAALPHAHLHSPVHASNTRAQSSLAARGRSSLAGRWQPSSSSTRRPCRHRRPRPTASRGLLPNGHTSWCTGSRRSAAGHSPSCRPDARGRPWSSVRQMGGRQRDLQTTARRQTTTVSRCGPGRLLEEDMRHGSVREAWAVREEHGA